MTWLSVKITRPLLETEKRLRKPTRKYTRKNTKKLTWKTIRKQLEKQIARTVLAIAFSSFQPLEETIFENT